jgi:predicted DsbA family dithiol-disulfide isomerase
MRHEHRVVGDIGMTRPVNIDVIADVSCPWSAIGLAELRRALVLSSGLIDAEIVLRPYELNPWMPAGGQNLMEYSAWMHGMDPAAFDRRRAVLRERAAEADVDMAIDADSRIHNTFDAHRPPPLGSFATAAAAARRGALPGEFRREPRP